MGISHNRLQKPTHLHQRLTNTQRLSPEVVVLLSWRVNFSKYTSLVTYNTMFPLYANLKSLLNRVWISINKIAKIYKQSIWSFYLLLIICSTTHNQAVGNKRQESIGGVFLNDDHRWRFRLLVILSTACNWFIIIWFPMILLERCIKVTMIVCSLSYRALWGTLLYYRIEDSR